MANSHRRVQVGLLTVAFIVLASMLVTAAAEESQASQSSPDPTSNLLVVVDPAGKPVLVPGPLKIAACESAGTKEACPSQCCCSEVCCHADFCKDMQKLEATLAGPSHQARAAAAAPGADAISPALARLQQLFLEETQNRYMAAKNNNAATASLRPQTTQFDSEMQQQQPSPQQYANNIQPQQAYNGFNMQQQLQQQYGRPEQQTGYINQQQQYPQPQQNNRQMIPQQTSFYSSSNNNNNNYQQQQQASNFGYQQPQQNGFQNANTNSGMNYNNNNAINYNSQQQQQPQWPQQSLNQASSFSANNMPAGGNIYWPQQMQQPAISNFNMEPPQQPDNKDASTWTWSIPNLNAHKSSLPNIGYTDGQVQSSQQSNSNSANNAPLKSTETQQQHHLTSSPHQTSANPQHPAPASAAKPGKLSVALLLRRQAPLALGNRRKRCWGMSCWKSSSCEQCQSAAASSGCGGSPCCGGGPCCGSSCSGCGGSPCCGGSSCCGDSCCGGSSAAASSCCGGGASACASGCGGGCGSSCGGCGCGSPCGCGSGCGCGGSPCGAVGWGGMMPSPSPCGGCSTGCCCGNQCCNCGGGWSGWGNWGQHAGYGTGGGWPGLGYGGGWPGVWGRKKRETRKQLAIESHARLNSIGSTDTQ